MRAAAAVPRGDRRQRREEGWTVPLAAALLGLGILQNWGSARKALDATAATSWEIWDEGQWWRLLTGALVHGGEAHLVMNLLATVSLGRLTDALAGRAALPLVFLAGAIAGNVAETGPWWGQPKACVGASGGLFALLMFCAWVSWRGGDGALARSLIINFAMMMGIGLFFIDQIGNAAHLGGAAVGGTLGVLWTVGGSGGRAILRMLGHGSAPILVLAVLGTGWLLVRAGG